MPETSVAKIRERLGTRSASPDKGPERSTAGAEVRLPYAVQGQMRRVGRRRFIGNRRQARSGVAQHRIEDVCLPGQGRKVCGGDGRPRPERLAGERARTAEKLCLVAA